MSPVNDVLFDPVHSSVVNNACANDPARSFVMADLTSSYFFGISDDDKVLQVGSL